MRSMFDVEQTRAWIPARERMGELWEQGVAARWMRASRCPLTCEVRGSPPPLTCPLPCPVTPPCTALKQNIPAPHLPDKLNVAGIVVAHSQPPCPPQTFPFPVEPYFVDYLLFLSCPESWEE